MSLSTWNLLNDPDDPRHGTFNAYSNHGCRCDKCKRCNADRTKKYRKARRSAPTPNHVHGTEAGYVEYACRCARCKAAWAAGQKGRYHRGRGRQEKTA